MLEKDYYITIILSKINFDLSNELIFKGATCLSKIYYTYYRLSEDLDFSIKLPANNVTRGQRRKVIKPVKDLIESFADKLGLKVEGEERAGHNESRQYIYYLVYSSLVLNSNQSVKLEISLRFNPISPIVKKEIRHKFLQPFTGEPLINTGTINCLSLKELVSEKLRAAATRLNIASRDFYDLGYLIKSGFDFKDEEFLKLFQSKLKEEGFSTDLKDFRYNLGRTEKEINDMRSRLKDELFPLLPFKERTSFNIQNVLDYFNKILKKY